MSEPTADELLVKVRDLIETTDPEEDAREILNDLHILWDKLEGHILAGDLPSKWCSRDRSPLPGPSPVREDLWKMAYIGAVTERTLSELSSEGWFGGGAIQLPSGALPLVEKLLSPLLFEQATDENLLGAVRHLRSELARHGELQEYEVALIERGGTLAPLFMFRGRNHDSR